MTKRVRNRRVRTARLIAWINAGRQPASRREESARRFLALAFGA